MNITRSVNLPEEDALRAKDKEPKPRHHHPAAARAAADFHSMLSADESADTSKPKGGTRPAPTTPHAADAPVDPTTSGAVPLYLSSLDAVLSPGIESPGESGSSSTPDAQAADQADGVEAKQAAVGAADSAAKGRLGGILGSPTTTDGVESGVNADTLSSAGLPNAARPGAGSHSQAALDRAAPARADAPAPAPPVSALPLVSVASKSDGHGAQPPHLSPLSDAGKVAPATADASAGEKGGTGGHTASDQRFASKGKEATSAEAVQSDKTGVGIVGIAAPVTDATGSGAADKNLTTVNAMSSAQNAGQGPSRSADIAGVRSAQNQLVMRQVATGELVHPELGRVQVSAHMRDGEVDVRVVAQRSETASFLTPRIDAMVADARSANVPVSRVDIESHAGTSQQPPTSSGNGGGHGARNPKNSHDDDGTSYVEAPATKRVRIVL